MRTLPDLIDLLTKSIVPIFNPDHDNAMHALKMLPSNPPIMVRCRGW